MRRTSKECVFCKVVSPLSIPDNLAAFLKGLQQYPKNKVVAKQRLPIKSSNEQDLDMASSRRFLVHSAPGVLKDPKSPDLKEGESMDNVSIVSSHSGSTASVR